MVSYSYIITFKKFIINPNINSFKKQLELYKVFNKKLKIGYVKLNNTTKDNINHQAIPIILYTIHNREILRLKHSFISKLIAIIKLI
jgi:hypothetical protein